MANKTRLVGKIEKGWGHEEIWVSNDKYCGKFLYFKEGGQFSMHFHQEKQETWHFMSGKFELRVLDLKTASIATYIYEAGAVLTMFPMTPHSLRCIEKGIVLEVSTPDSVEDNYRVMKGDSQKT